LPALKKPKQTLTRADFKGHVSLLNVWATWCFACREEHQTLLKFAKRGVVPIYGLDYKDKRNAALAWLKQAGDPYRAIAFDRTGNVAMNWGVYGAPETFLVDANGIIRYKHIGPLTAKSIRQELLPRIRKLKQGRP
jgi:cytochrome c biogenesis protein CcmG/thiol:disulfide interchange protein DsbE